MSSKKLKPKSQREKRAIRIFSESFKQAKVKEIQSKLVSVSEVSRIHEVSRSAIYKWLYKYAKQEKGTKLVVEMESESLKTKRLQQRLAELERIIGQKQLEIDFLHKTLDLATEEVGYDIKKKYGPMLSNGTEPTLDNTPGA
jgi:transposase-like protein